MKNLVSISALAVLFVSCSKNDSHNMVSIQKEERDSAGIVQKSTMQKIDGKTTYEDTFGYIAYNGKRASVTFRKNEKENTINILSNGKTFNLDYQKDTPTGKLFSRNGIEAETKGDSLFIRSGEIIIELKRVK